MTRVLTNMHKNKQAFFAALRDWSNEMDISYLIMMNIDIDRLIIFSVNKHLNLTMISGNLQVVRKKILDEMQR